MRLRPLNCVTEEWHRHPAGGIYGYFSINVKTKKEPWRIILQPLDDKHEPYSGSEIVEIARSVRMVKIVEVSKHYE